MKNQNRNLLMANIGMNKKQIKFIDEIVREIRFSGGKKPPRSSIVNTFIKIAMLIKLDISGVKSEKEAEKRFFQAFRNATRRSKK